MTKLLKKIVIALGLIGLGGCMNQLQRKGIGESNNRNQITEEIGIKIRETQNRMVKYLCNNYEDIKKIKFTSFDKNIKTGTWSSNAIVNDNVYVTFGVYNINDNSEISVGQHISQSAGLELKKKITPDDISVKDVEVVYFIGGN